MTRLVDEFGFRYQGMKKVEHIYFYSAGAVGAEGRQEAYRFGKEYCLL